MAFLQIGYETQEPRRLNFGVATSATKPQQAVRAYASTAGDGRGNASRDEPTKLYSGGINFEA